MKVYKLHEDAKIPIYSTEGACCFDIFAYLIGLTGITILPGETTKIETGLILDIPRNHAVKIYSRSGLALKKGLALINGVGIIDYDYVDELCVMLHNYSNEPQRIEHGDRVAQGELVRSHQYKLIETVVKPTKKTDRVGGFGSTGF